MRQLRSVLLVLCLVPGCVPRALHVQTRSVPGAGTTGWRHVARDVTGDGCADLLQVGGGDQAFSPVTLHVGVCDGSVPDGFIREPPGAMTQEAFFGTNVVVVPAMLPFDGPVAVFSTYAGHCGTLHADVPLHTGIFAVDLGSLDPGGPRLPTPRKIHGDALVRTFALVDGEGDGPGALLLSGQDLAGEVPCPPAGGASGAADARQARRDHGTKARSSRRGPRNLFLYAPCTGDRCRGPWEPAPVWRFWPSGQEHEVTALAVADVDGDGAQDIVAALGTDRVVLLVGDGTRDGYPTAGSSDVITLVDLDDRVASDIDLAQDGDGTTVVVTTACLPPDTRDCDPRKPSPVWVVEIPAGPAREPSSWSRVRRVLPGLGTASAILDGADGVELLAARFVPGRGPMLVRTPMRGRMAVAPFPFVLDLTVLPDAVAFTAGSLQGRSGFLTLTHAPETSDVEPVDNR